MEDHARVTRRSVLAAAGAAMASAAMPAWAQADYPNRPIKLIVAYAPGGPVDSSGRLLAAQLSAKLGQQVIVENKPGAGGVIGHDFVAKATADGYTLLYGASPPQTISPHVQAKVPFDPLKDHTPVSQVLNYANVLCVNKDLPIRNVAELVAYAKANPDQVTYGSAGMGGSNHLSGELLAKMTGTKMVHVPYKGNNPAMTDVIGGKITMMFDITNTAANLHKAGKVRAIAVTSAKRNNALPDVPTMAESGLPGYEVVGWMGVLGPAGLPRPIVDKLNAAIGQVLADKAFVEKFESLGLDPEPSTPEAFQSLIRKDLEFWGKVVRDANIPRG
ncbi:MAG: hypothetical protein RIS35_2337 [Pseudomonadota bacterium]